jgi:ABC-type multidrug transport system fused ATPase/permease subunit
MLVNIFYRLFGVSKEALEFILDNKFKNRLWLIVPLTVWTSVTYQVTPIFLKWQIDTLTGNLNKINFLNASTTDLGQIFLIVTLGMLALTLIDNLITYFRDNAFQRLNIHSEGYLEDKFTDFLKRFDGSFLGAENNVRIIRNIQWDIHNLQENFINILQKLIDIPISTIALLGILQLIHPYLLITIVVSVLLSLASDNLESQAWRRFEMIQNRKQEQRSELRWRLVWYFNNLLANGWLQEIYDSYKKRREDFFEINYQMNKTSRGYQLGRNIINSVTNSVGTVVAAFLVISHAVTIGTFTIFGSYISRLSTLMQSLGDLIRMILEMRYSLFKIDFLIHIRPKLDYSNIQKFNEADISSITFKNLNFKYPPFYTEEYDFLTQMRQKLGILDEEKQAKELEKAGIFKKLFAKIAQANTSKYQKKQLKKEFEELEKMFNSSKENKQILEGLSYSFQKGKVYGIVGYNGAGKTTLTKLIKRTLDPESGQILVNGRDLKTVDPLVWRNYIASVEQESFVWSSLSVRENLELGMYNPNGKKFELSDDQIWDSLDKVGLKESISSLDLILDENLELSGGQKQLLEIARVYLQKKPIIILDEGTNQLDALKENKIIETLQYIKQNSIVIFITHRITTSNKCDEILVLQDGEITATGKPKELLSDNQNNLYKTFWQLQVEGKTV